MTSPNEILFQNNPFIEIIAAEPWDNDYPIVESINSSTFSQLYHLIKKKQEKPNATLAAVITGELGFGKTQFIRRILEITDKKNSLTLFTYVRPILNSSSPLQFLLKSITTDLSKSRSENGSNSQFHLLLSGILISYLQSHNLTSFVVPKNFEDDNIFKNSDGIALFDNYKSSIIDDLAANCGDIESTFLKILFQYPDINKRRQVIDWLKGEPLDEEDYTTIGLSKHRKDDICSIEEEARNIIISLGLLFEKCNMTLLLCFDQLENIETDGQVKGFSNIIDTIVNHTHSFLPMAFVRKLFWDDDLKPKLPAHIRDRLSLEYNLTGCSIEQAKEIIRKRISFFFKEQTCELFDWVIVQLEGQLKEGLSPRKVLTKCKEVIIPSETEPENSEINPKLVINNFLQDQYRMECSQVLANLNDWPSDGAQLSKALETFLINHDGFVKIIHRDNDQISIVISCKKINKELKYGFFINVKNMWQSVNKTLKTAIEFLKKNPDALCYFITDPRCHIKSTWKVVNESLSSFNSLNGKVLNPSNEEISRWYALVSLLFKIKEGSIQIDAENIVRSITENEFNRFIGSKEQFKSLIKPDDSDGKADCAKITKEVISVLKQASFPVLTTDKLSQNLSKSGYTISEAFIIECCGRQKESFKVVEISQGTAIMYKRYRGKNADERN